MPHIHSVQAAFLNALATHSSEDITKVLVNDSFEITALTKTVTDNQLVIEFGISEGDGGIDVITNIKLLTADDTVFDSSPCSVPLLGDLHPKFKIPFTEVLN